MISNRKKLKQIDRKIFVTCGAISAYKKATKIMIKIDD